MAEESKGTNRANFQMATTAGNLQHHHSAQSWEKSCDSEALSRKPCKACQRQEALNAVDGPSEEHVCCTSLEPPDSHSSLQEQEVIRVTTRGDQLRAKQQLKVGQEILNGWTPGIRASQLNDSDIALLLQAIEGGTDRPSRNTISSGTSALKTLWRQWERLEVQA